MLSCIDYKHSIVQVMNAVRTYVGVTPHHRPDHEILQWLNEHAFKQVIVLLIDGLGSQQIKRYCSPSSFLATHLRKSVHTVFPPTTTAATTTILSGKMPYETGWLGWQQYFEEIDEHLIMFMNTAYYTKQPYKDSQYTYEHVPFKSMIEECHEKQIPATDIYPAFKEGGVHSFNELCERIVDESKQQQHSFIYAYWDAYDTMMHRQGVDAPQSVSMLQDIDKMLSWTMPNLHEDTGLIILADHGQCNVRHVTLQNYPQLLACLKHKPSLEARAISFAIKDGMHETFEQLFQTYFKDSFLLLNQQQVMDEELFGYGIQHPLFKTFIADYVAIATADIQLVYTDTSAMKGDHSGTSTAEMIIPIILYTGKEESS